MIKQLFTFLLLSTTASLYFSCSSNITEITTEEEIKTAPKEEETQIHVPITAFWWNGGWDHYDPELLKHLDEIIIFAIPANPNTGDLLKHSSSTPEETVYIKGKTEPGLTTTMIKTITDGAKDNNVKVTLGINGMGRKEKYFNDLVRNNKHEIFADSILSFCKKWKIDGVDIDYEHIVTTEDADFLTAIVTALVDKLHPEGYHVSGAFGINRQPVLDWLQNNHQLLDQINVMGYLNTPEWCDTNLNQLHTELGIPKHKIYGGIGFYAKDKKNKVSFVYRDLVNITTVNNTEDIFTLPNPTNPKQTLNLLYHNSEQSLTKKVNFIRDNEFGGIMIWELSDDVPTTDPNSRIKFLRSITQ